MSLLENGVTLCSLSTPVHSKAPVFHLTAEGQVGFEDAQCKALFFGNNQNKRQKETEEIQKTKSNVTRSPEV